jgi:DUF1680 family protein
LGLYNYIKEKMSRIPIKLVELGVAIGIIVVFGVTISGGEDALMGKDYPIKPVTLTQVNVKDEFWATRIETNRKITIPYEFRKCEETGRINNFAIAGGLMKGQQSGDFPFDDTDPYKIIEGASYSLSIHPDAELDRYLDDLIAKIAAAQEDDGYLYTCRTNKYERLKNWYGEKRWSNLNGSHELYNAGHLYEAAVAHYLATGKGELLDVAVKNADLLCQEFGPGKLEKWPGHQIVEMGLVKLYRVTGNEKYLNLAKFFLDVRGPGGGEYSQSHKKVIEQDAAVGHAVRAVYMYSGMVDVAQLTGEKTYLETSERIWNNVVGEKLYITGGIGATGQWEGFGKNYDLPNSTAYCETCASIGNVFWNHRMFLATEDAKYIDVLERTLYNALLSGVSLSGDTFFYPNPLESRGNYKRSGWFSCACCPSNIARFIPQIPGYIYALRGDKIYINLFVNNSATVKTDNNTVQLTQETQYPWDGKVKITVEPKRHTKFAIYVRIPGWAQNKPVPGDLYSYSNTNNKKARIRVNGKKLVLNTEKGFARIERNWKKGDVIELDLPMQIRRVIANDRVAADVGRVALERGPIVYCAEGIDNNGHVLNLILPDDTELKTEYRQDLLNGVMVIHGKAIALNYGENLKSVEKKEQKFTAIPYYAWAHRGAGEMVVWLARDEAVAEPLLPVGMIRNASFEETDNNDPVGWERRTWRGEGKFQYVKEGHTGKHSVMMASKKGGDLSWMTHVIVKTNSKYKLSGWIKTENLQDGTGKGALFNIHNIQSSQTPPVTGTKDWTKVEVEFDSGDNESIQINCLFGGWGLSTGKAWYDDIGLELVSTGSEENKINKNK